VGCRSGCLHHAHQLVRTARTRAQHSLHAGESHKTQIHASRTPVERRRVGHILYMHAAAAPTHTYTHTRQTLTNGRRRLPQTHPPTTIESNLYLYERRHIMHTLDPFNQSVPQHHIHIRGNCTQRHRVRACLVAGRPAAQSPVDGAWGRCAPSHHSRSCLAAIVDLPAPLSTSRAVYTSRPNHSRPARNFAQDARDHVYSMSLHLLNTWPVDLALLRTRCRAPIRRAAFCRCRHGFAPPVSLFR
jgi:hypothetical protein